MAINLVDNFVKYIDYALTLNALTNGIGVVPQFEYLGQKTFKVFSFTTEPLVDYTRSGTQRYGTTTDVQDVFQILTVIKDRGFSRVIDKGDYIQQGFIKTATSYMAQMASEQIIPEIDMYRLFMVVSKALPQNIKTATVDINNAYQFILDGNATLTNNKVPVTGRKLYAEPSFVSLLKRSQLVKSGDSSQTIASSGSLGKIDGLELIEVPVSYLPAKVSFIITYPPSTLLINQLEDYIIHENPVGYNGNVMEARLIYDLFVLNQKLNCIYVHKTP